MERLTQDPFRAARLLLHLRQEGVTDTRVLTAMEALGRAAFVDDPALAHLAYEDAVLPIPCGQVILRPAATGHLLQALALPDDRSAKVLLVGLGSGYMTALLAGLCAQVFAVDRFASLVRAGAGRLEHLGISNAILRQSDGLHGWPEEAPFDRIVLAGSVLRVPDGLLAQLAPGGRLSAPVLTSDGGTIVSVDAGGSVRTCPSFPPVPGLVSGVARVL